MYILIGYTIVSFFLALFSGLIIGKIMDFFNHIIGTPTMGSLSSRTQCIMLLVFFIFWVIVLLLMFIKKYSTPRNQRILALKKFDVDSMNGDEFENYCVKLLGNNGFSQIRTTPSTSDRGIDILAKKAGKLYAIQCKRYSSNVGNKAVQEAYSGKSIYKADYSVVMTNSQFTKQAIKDAKALNVLLWDRSAIEKFLELKY